MSKKIYIADSSDPIVVAPHAHGDGRSFDTFVVSHALEIEKHNRDNPNNKKTLHLEDPTPPPPASNQGGG